MMTEFNQALHSVTADTAAGCSTVPKARFPLATIKFTLLYSTSISDSVAAILPL